MHNVYSTEYIKHQKWFYEESWLNAFGASLVSGIFIALLSNPFDLLTTRCYIQRIDRAGRGKRDLIQEMQKSN